VSGWCNRRAWPGTRGPRWPEKSLVDPSSGRLLLKAVWNDVVCLVMPRHVPGLPALEEIISGVWKAVKKELKPASWMGRRFRTWVVSPRRVSLSGPRSFPPQRTRSQRFSQFLSALCVLCGIIKPAFASNTQDGDYRNLIPTASAINCNYSGHVRYADLWYTIKGKSFSLQDGTACSLFQSGIHSPIQVPACSGTDSVSDVSNDNR
jgi:hypothetical protein